MAIWMSPWVIGMEYGLKSHKKQALMSLKPHVFNEGYIGHFDGLRADIKAPFPTLAVTSFA